MEGKIDKVKDKLLELGFSKEEEKHLAPKGASNPNDLYLYRYSMQIQHFTLIINFMYDLSKKGIIGELCDESGIILFEEDDLEERDNTIYISNFESIEDIQTLLKILQ